MSQFLYIIGQINYHDMKRIACILGAVFLLFGWRLVHASTPLIYIEGPRDSVAVDSKFSVTIKFDSDQSLNAYSVAVKYDPTVLNLISLDNSHSVIDVWPRQPVVSQVGKITFSG